MKKPVPQEDSFGCGVACMAFVADKTYHEIREIIPDGTVNDAKLYCPDIVKFLKQFDLDYEYRTVETDYNKNITISRKGMNDLTKVDNAIIFIPPSKTFPVGHFLATYEEKFMNPWANIHERYNLNVRAEFQDNLPYAPTWIVFPRKEQK